MKKKPFELTNTELELMEVFWSTDDKLTFKELMRYANEVLKKDWKKQTLSTYLKHLQDGGMIGVHKKNSKYFDYYPLYTRSQYMQVWTKSIVENSFSNSLCNFIAAFTGGNKISKEEAESLKKYL